MGPYQTLYLSSSTVWQFMYKETKKKKIRRCKNFLAFLNNKKKQHFYHYHKRSLYDVGNFSDSTEETYDLNKIARRDGQTNG